MLLTVAVLGGGLALYTWMQPPTAARKADSPIATTRHRPQGGPTMRGVGEGKSPLHEVDVDKLAEILASKALPPAE